MKNFIVTFGASGARIVKGINPDDYRDMPNVLVNPDLEPVRGVPPHLWTLADGKLAVGEPRTESVTRATSGHGMALFWLKVAALSTAISLLVRFL